MQTDFVHLNVFDSTDLSLVFEPQAGGSQFRVFLLLDPSRPCPPFSQARSATKRIDARLQPRDLGTPWSLCCLRSRHTYRLCGSALHARGGQKSFFNRLT